MQKDPDQKNKIQVWILYGVAYLLGAFVVLAVLNYKNLLNVLEGAGNIRDDSLSNYVGTAILHVATLIDRLPHSQTALTFIFWLFVGLVGYIAILFLSFTVFNLFRDEDIVMHYQTPLGDTKSSLVKRILVHWAFVVTLSLMALFLVVILLSLILPASHDVFMSAWYHPANVQSWLYSLGAVTTLALSLAATVFALRLWWRVSQG